MRRRIVLRRARERKPLNLVGDLLAACGLVLLCTWLWSAWGWPAVCLGLGAVLLVLGVAAAMR